MARLLEELGGAVPDSKQAGQDVRPQTALHLPPQLPSGQAEIEEEEVTAAEGNIQLKRRVLSS